MQMYFWALAFSHNWNITSFTSAPITKEAEDFPATFVQDLPTRGIGMWKYFFFARKKMRQLRPDVIMTRGGRNRNLLFVALWAKLFGSKVVHFLASDVELDKIYNSFEARVNKKMFHHGLKYVDYFVAQNEYQRAVAQQRYPGAKVLIIPNVWGALPEKNDVAALTEKGFVLWVGNTRRLKRPQWVFEIAKQFPDLTFVMIGGNSDNEVYEQCLQLAKQTPNVRFMGSVQFFDTDQYFKQTKYLLCTSEYEGFPNTFLQAWSHNVPVLSTVDPSGVIGRHGLGANCAEIEDFETALRDFECNPERYKAACSNISAYFEQAHSVASNYRRLMDFLDVQDNPIHS